MDGKRNIFWCKIMLFQNGFCMAFHVNIYVFYMENTTFLEKHGAFCGEKSWGFFKRGGVYYKQLGTHVVLNL